MCIYYRLYDLKKSVQLIVAYPIFVVGSIIAACDGDYSGIAAIGKFVGFFVLLFAVLWLFTQPVLLIIAIVVLVLIVICCSAK